MKNYFRPLPPGQRPPGAPPSNKADIRKYLTSSGGQKKQKAEQEWVQDDDPVDRLEEQGNENRDVRPHFEPKPPRFSDQRTKDAEYAPSSLDANQRPIVPHGWLDTTREGKLEVIAAAQKQAPNYGLDIVPGEYGHQINARKTFRKGDWVAPYRGVRMNNEDVDKLPNTYDKIVPTTDRKWNVVGDIQNPDYPSIGAYANDPGMEWNEAVDGKATDPKKIVGNTRFFQKPDGTMWLRADSDIKPGEEVTVNYGENYWLSDGPETALAYFKNPRYIEKRMNAKN
jgi:hypothetical protein